MLCVQLRQALLLVIVFFVGCSYPQNKVVIESGNQDKILFRGENIDVIESVKSNLEKISFESKENEFCFEEIDAKIKDKLSGLDLKESTKYFKFDSQKKFTLRLTKEQSAKISLDLIKKLDSFADLVDSKELYFIKNAQHEYLVMIGKPLGATGVGLYYWNYLIVQMNSNKKVLEIGSVSNNPKTVRIDDSGIIYYTQIDQNYYPRPASKTDSELNYFPVTVSLFTFDGVSNKKFEFSFDCKNPEQR